MADETHKKIEQAAETLFANNGYEGTSIRDITQEAKVSLSAVNYHYKSKQGLLLSMADTRLLPLQTMRLNKLEKCQGIKSKDQRLRAVIDAFLDPVADLIKQGILSTQFTQVMARVFSETPELGKILFSNYFKRTEIHFVKALGEIYTNKNREDIVWYFHLMLATFLDAMKSDARICNLLDAEAGSISMSETLNRTKSFVTAAAHSLGSIN